MIIAVDFDGTCVAHEFPKVGKDIGAAPILKKLVEKGHKIILYTMRSHPDKNNQGLQECIDRDSKRPNPIGEEVIRKTYEKYKDILEA